MAETMRLLIACGPAGFTSGEASPLKWARRISAYVFKLREAGVPIVTLRETIGDGVVVGRYSLSGPVAILGGEGAKPGTNVAVLSLVGPRRAERPRPDFGGGLGRASGTPIDRLAA